MTKTRVSEIDLLRFIAALLVVFFHYCFRGFAAENLSVMPYPLLAPVAKYGYLGVDLFFIISGFVILMTAANGSLRDFVVSRIVRLYPAFWACCTISFLAIVLFGAPRFTASVGEYLVNMTMASGFLGVPSIDGVYWSLFVEIRFYGLVALVLLLGQIRHAQTLLILWLIAAAVITVKAVPSLRYALIVDYAAYFIAGATCFLVWSQGLSAARIGLIAGAWILALVRGVRSIRAFEQIYATELSAVAVCAIISTFFAVMILVSLRRTGFWGRRRWLAAGALTYPLYLLHENLGFILFNHAYPAVNPHLLLWGAIAAVIGLAYGVHIGIERRFAPLLKAAINGFLDRAKGLATAR